MWYVTKFGCSIQISQTRKESAGEQQRKHLRWRSISTPTRAAQCDILGRLGVLLLSCCLNALPFSTSCSWSSPQNWAKLVRSIRNGSNKLASVRQITTVSPVHTACVKSCYTFAQGPWKTPSVCGFSLRFSHSARKRRSFCVGAPCLENSPYVQRTTNCTVSQYQHIPKLYAEVYLAYVSLTSIRRMNGNQSTSLQKFVL